MLQVTTFRFHRRALLCGIAATAAAGVFAPVTAAIFDRLVLRDGWVLRQSDLDRSGHS
ncbi:hypothetical protein [Oricola sp.]|uniref:hypothetical protein n=1 Tax=Oricola sp. TaxID=1979950 RepID=UPI003BA93F24